jgi:hypothetical protein
LIASSHQIPSRIFYISPVVELLVVEIMPTHQTPLYLCCIYAPPNCSEQYLTDIITCLHVIPPNSHLVLVGDFNLPDVDWEQLYGRSPSSNMFCESLFNLNLLQLVLEPTHIHGNTLDLIITNHPDKICNISIAPSQQPSSDHYLITFQIDCTDSSKTSKHHTKCKKFLHSKADNNRLQHYLSNVNLDNLATSDVNTIWSFLSHVLHEACSNFIPKITIHKSSPRYFTPEIRHSLNVIRSLKRLIKKNPTPHRLEKLSLLEHSLQAQLQTAKQEYETRLINMFYHNPEKLYNYLKHTSSSHSIPQIVHHQSITYGGVLVAQ